MRPCSTISAIRPMAAIRMQAWFAMLPGIFMGQPPMRVVAGVIWGKAVVWYSRLLRRHGKRYAPPVSGECVVRPSSQPLRSREGIDLCALPDIADRNKLVRSVRHGQQSRAIGVRGNATLCIEAGFEQARAHLKGGQFSGHAGDMTRQDRSKRILR